MWAGLACCPAHTPPATPPLYPQPQWMLWQECAAIVSCQLERHAEAVETIIGGMRLLEDKLAEAKLEKGTQAMAALNLEVGGVWPPMPLCWGAWRPVHPHHPLSLVPPAPAAGGPDGGAPEDHQQVQVITVLVDPDSLPAAVHSSTVSCFTQTMRDV